MNYNEAFTQRYSVKKFDKSKVVPEEVLERILQAGKLSASSLGLQPYKIYVVESDEVKEQLVSAFHNPSQMSTCSHLVVLVTKKNVDDAYLDGYFRHIKEVRSEMPDENLALFRKNINYYLDSKSAEEMLIWNEKQSYIVLGNLMFASALEGVDTCPMEGFKKDKIEEILNINPELETVSVTLALGYRSSEDDFQHLNKVRKPDDKLFKRI